MQAEVEKDMSKQSSGRLESVVGMLLEIKVDIAKSGETLKYVAGFIEEHKKEHTEINKRCADHAIDKSAQGAYLKVGHVVASILGAGLMFLLVQLPWSKIFTVFASTN